MSTLPNYHDDPHKYYQVLKRLTPDELTREWREITSRDDDYLLDCVPPRAINTSAFMVGECMTHADHGPIYEVCVCITCGASRRYFARPAHLHTWHKNDYAAEIRKQFNISPKEQTL